MAGKAAVTVREAAVDFAALVVRAVVGGVGVAVAMALAILALSATAQAAGMDDAKTGRLLLRGSSPGQYTVAPTVGTEVAIRVTGMVARTRVTQYFHNPGSDFVEGVYVFPLPESAAVDRLRMKIGERRIEGQVREKAEARRAYEQAKQEGRKAALVEQQRPNLFTNAVAHIGPGEDVMVEIEYQQALAYEGGQYRLRFPLAVTPRYTPLATRQAIPDEPKAFEARSGLEPVVNPAYEFDGCGGGANVVDIAVAIDLGMPLTGIESSYHDIGVQKDSGHVTTVYLVKDQEEADRDFELTWRVAAGAAPQAAMFLEGRGTTDYALLMVMPPDPTAAERAMHRAMPRETILVVDTSGSMQGASIEQAREALDYALKTLTPRDRFNVVEFNSAMRALFPEALPASHANIAQARDWVRRLKAEGGTEMAPALAFALDGRATPGLLRQVIFMTDGAVGNEDALFRLIAEKLGESRLFTVGIGSAPNGHFMAKAAQFGRGSFTHIGHAREVNEKMTRLFGKIEAPVLRDVAIRRADGTPLETYPARVPDLYLGEPIVVSAALPAPAGVVIVSGLRGNQPWSVALTPGAGGEAAGVGALWARSRIASLMDEMRRGGDAPQLRAAVVKVALEHHLVSAYTSLVAVDVTPTAPANAATPAALVKARMPLGNTMDLPQTDTAATLHLLMGALALAAALMVTLVGRRAMEAA